MFRVLSRANRERRGIMEMERGEVEQQLNLSRWHLFYFLPGHLEFTQTDDFIIKHWPTSQLWHSPHTYTHTYRIRQQLQSDCVLVRHSKGACMCMACFYLAHITLQIHTNVFISGPVKMSSLCLFSPHSEWHNIGLKDAIINLNVPWHFPPPPSTCVKTLITALTEDWSLSQLHGLQEKVKSNQLTSFTWRRLLSDTCAEM